MASARGNLFDGPVRTGKTITSILKWIEYIRQAPPGALAMLGNTERTLERNVLDPMIDILGRRRCRPIYGAGKAIILGRTVYLAGAHNIKAVEKIRGMTLAGWYGDEITTWPKAVFDMARTRLSVPGARWFGTTNPGSSRHWLKLEQMNKARLHLQGDGTLVERRGPEWYDLAVFSSRLEDNPFLEPEYIESLKREYVGIFYKRYILGQWCAAEGAIFEMFDPDRHVVEPGAMPHVHRWVSLGVDYGTMNPFHSLAIGLASDQRLYVADEWRHDGRATRRQMTDLEYVSALKAQMGDRRFEAICVDPSASSLRTEAWRQGLSFYAADNGILDGIRLVCSAIAGDYLRVSSSCRHLLGEMPGYAWSERDPAVEEPVKEDDHGCDALRYGIKTTEQAWRFDVRSGTLGSSLQ